MLYVKNLNFLNLLFSFLSHQHLVTDSHKYILEVITGAILTFLSVGHFFKVESVLTLEKSLPELSPIIIKSRSGLGWKEP